MSLAHGHAHEHDHGALHGPSHERQRGQRSLRLVLALTAGYMLAEAIGGYLGPSLALLADAGA